MNQIALLEAESVQKWIKFTSSQAGRDKIYRFVQYFGKFLVHHLQATGSNSDFAIRIHKLVTAVALARKLFRMGKTLDFAHILAKSLNNKNEVIKWGAIMKSVGYGGWLLLDSIQWLQAVGFLSIDKETIMAINKNAPRLWFVGIFSSLLTNLYKIHCGYLQRSNGVHLLSKGEPLGLTSFFDTEMQTISKDTVQDLIDLIIPLSLMNWIKVSPGTVGLAGSITSLMGASSIYPK